MRQFLAVVFLGATLAFGAGAARAADDKVDYVLSYQRTQNAPVVSWTVSRTSDDSVVAGGGCTTATCVYQRLRDENSKDRSP